MINILKISGISRGIGFICLLVLMNACKATQVVKQNPQEPEVEILFKTINSIIFVLLNPPDFNRWEGFKIWR